MKIIHFIILLISISIVASGIISLFPWTNQNRFMMQGNWGNITLSSSSESTRNYISNYNCLVSTKNTDFNYLLKDYESSYQKNNNYSFYNNK